MDEFAFLPNNLADEFIASVFPTLSSSKESKLVITSTPNGSFWITYQVICMKISN